MLYGIFASIVFGAGMAMIMAFEGLMIPMCLGLKDSKVAEKNYTA